MDEYLFSQELWRKHIPRDGSCLFRAVSEQVFHTQTYHLKIREKCVKFLREHEALFVAFIEGDYDQYLEKLSSPNEWAGHVEMEALSVMYKRDFLVYQEVGRSPIKVTENGFQKIIMLCYSHGNHYDSVYPRSDLADAAFCQSVLYGILYKAVFKLGDDVDLAVERMLHDKSYSKQKRNALCLRRELYRKGGGNSIIDKDNEKKEESGEGEIKKALAQGLPPFPYKVAKVLDPEIYRNVEYDLWNEIRKEQARSEQLVVPDIIPGVKCIVRMEEYKFDMHAHVQRMVPDNGPVTVYIEELGEMKMVPYESLHPIPIPIYKALAMETTGRNRAVHAYLRSIPISFDRFKGRKKISRKNLKDLPMILPLVQSTSVIHLTHNPMITTSTPLRNSYQKQHQQISSKDSEIQMKENPSKSLIPCQMSHSSIPQDLPYWNTLPPVFKVQQNQLSPISSSVSSTELEAQTNATLLSLDMSHREESKILDISSESGFYSNNKTMEIAQLQNSPMSVQETSFIQTTSFPIQASEQSPYPYGATCPFCPYFILSPPPNPEQETATIQGNGFGTCYNIPFGNEVQQQGPLVSAPPPAWAYNGSFTYVFGPPPYGMYDYNAAEPVVPQSSPMPYLMFYNSAPSQVLTSTGPVIT